MRSKQNLQSIVALSTHLVIFLQTILAISHLANVNECSFRLVCAGENDLLCNEKARFVRCLPTKKYE